MDENKFDEAIDSFFEKCGNMIEKFFIDFPLSTQLIVSFIIAVFFLIIGCILLKKNKKIGGYIFAGFGIGAIVWKIIEILL